MQEPRIKKLPKWAQEFITQLYAANDHLKDEVESLQNDLQQSLDPNGEPTMVEWDRNYKEVYRLPTHACITFYLDKDCGLTDQIHVRLTQFPHESEYHLQIQGGSRLVIKPTASNSIRIYKGD